MPIPVLACSSSDLLRASPFSRRRAEQDWHTRRPGARGVPARDSGGDCANAAGPDSLHRHLDSNQDAAALGTGCSGRPWKSRRPRTPGTWGVCEVKDPGTRPKDAWHNLASQQSRVCLRPLLPLQKRRSHFPLVWSRQVGQPGLECQFRVFDTLLSAPDDQTVVTVHVRTAQRKHTIAEGVPRKLHPDGLPCNGIKCCRRTSSPARVASRNGRWGQPRKGRLASLGPWHLHQPRNDSQQVDCGRNNGCLQAGFRQARLRSHRRPHPIRGDPRLLW